MRLVSRALLTLSLLAAPAVGWACGACVDSQLRFMLPTYYWCLVLLLYWGFLHVAFAVRWDPNPTCNLQIKVQKILTYAAVFVGLLILGMGSMAFVSITLFVLFATVCTRILRGRPASPQAMWLALATGVLLLTFIGYGVPQHALRDRFDHARATVLSGTGPLRFLAAEFADDPGFDIERLRPLIREGSRNDREWAFHILMRRKNEADVELFFPEIAALPKGYFKRDDYSESGMMYFRMWIEGLGLNPADVERRVEEGQSADPVTPTP